jgi:hypothetical protein
MRPGATPKERFKGWFVDSIGKLKELPEGDGAFGAMMIALPLYERLVIAKLKVDGKPAQEEDVAREIGSDLQLGEVERRIFWSAFRVGFMHQAMGMSGRTAWLVSDRFGALPEIKPFKGGHCVCVDPWKFADRVLSAFMADPRLIVVSESFPLAEVYAFDTDPFSAGESK